jgi:RimJ/RimL family protein N-acetyltransferase
VVVIIEIKGNKISLRSLEKEDVEYLVKYTNNPELNKYSGPYIASTVEGANKYIDECNKGIEEKKYFRFGMYKNSHKLVGVIGFFDLDDKLKKGEVGFWVAKEYWGNGYATEALNLMTKYIFEELYFHKIFVFFHEKNSAVARILEKCGYEKEGLAKNSVYNGSEYYDEIIFTKVNTTTTT